MVQPPRRSRRLVQLAVAAALLGRCTLGFAQTPGEGPSPQPTLVSFEISGLSVYDAARVRQWLDLREGEPLPEPPERLAEIVRDRYRGDGYQFAEVTATMGAAGDLHILVDEGRVESVEVDGGGPTTARQAADALDIESFPVFNARRARRVLAPVIDRTEGASRLPDGESAFTLIDRDGHAVLKVALESRRHRVGVRLLPDREDWYTPVDGFVPAFGLTITTFDSDRLRHTAVTFSGTYRTASERAGYNAGFEQVLGRSPTVFVGASLYDLTASDDRWRLSPDEQSLVALTFGNTFREYYRQRGYQVQGGLQSVSGHELVVAWRDERHESLPDATGFSIWRDDSFRPNPPITDGRLHGLVLRYAFDTRGTSTDTPAERLLRHGLDDLYGYGVEQATGVRVEWTSEISPERWGSDFSFDRHIAQARGYLRLSPRQWVQGRMLWGGSGGELPAQRLFALGGIGSVRGYAFKQARGTGMFLTNAEYKLGLFGVRHEGSGVKLIGAFDAGRVFDPVSGSLAGWLTGAGFGFEFGDALRLDFGYRLDDIPQSLQVLVRLRPWF